MVTSITKSHLRIEKNRHWEDYESLKKFWGHKGKYLREYIFNGVQTATDTPVEFTAGHDVTITFLTENDIVYIVSEGDVGAFDGDSIWIDYVNKEGDLYENVESKFDSITGVNTEVPIGCESGLYVDTIKVVTGAVLTMNDLDMDTDELYVDLTGWYIVACGDATQMEGNYLTILSNSKEAPTKITCTTEPHSDWDEDNVSIQQHLFNDVYRIRRMWTETEATDNNYLAVCNSAGNAFYAAITDLNSYGSAGSRYYALSSTYRCFLGKVHLEAPRSFGADIDELAYVIDITFTPRSMVNPGSIYSGSKNGAASDITLTKEFIDVFDWQPCIELEPCTDVIFKMEKKQAQEYAEVSLDYTILEVDTT